MAAKFKIAETKSAASQIRATNVFVNCIRDWVFSFRNLKDLVV